MRRHQRRRPTAAQLAQLPYRALHPTRCAPSARAELPSDKGRLLRPLRSFPNLSLSEERSAKAAKRCRRVRCNARQFTTLDSFNRNAETPTPSPDSSTTRAVAVSSVAPLPSRSFGARRPPLGQGEVRSRSVNGTDPIKSPSTLP